MINYNNVRRHIRWIINSVYFSQKTRLPFRLKSKYLISKLYQKEKSNKVFWLKPLSDNDLKTLVAGHSVEKICDDIKFFLF